MAYEQGEVWWGPAPHKSSPAYRPWLIVSNTSHPFAEEECIVVAEVLDELDRVTEVPNK